MNVRRIFSDHPPADPDGVPQFSLADVSDDQIEWFPKFADGEPFPDVPDHVDAAASEAAACLGAGHYWAAVLMARSVIEATAKDKAITSGNLASKIDQMREQGLIREHISAAAHEIRHFGNDMAHGDFVEPVEPTDAQLALQLMREIGSVLHR